MKSLTDSILLSDSYKLSHDKQYPEGTQVVSSYIESRAGSKFEGTVFFGLQAYLNKLMKPITQEMVDDYRELVSKHVPGLEHMADRFQYIVDNHQGHLPLAIEAVAEGTVVPTGNVLVQVHNTDPKCFWLTSYIETQLLRAVWYPSTVATVSRRCRQIIMKYLGRTSENPEECIDFALHDFGSRGVSSGESSAIGGGAHLLNFLGTDNMEALVWLHDNYGADMAGFSIPASEHATVTVYGRHGEEQALSNMIDQYGHLPLIAFVSDSYDLDHMVQHTIGEVLKDKILAMNARLVIRPDSGHPPEVVLRTVRNLWNKFGGHSNKKGYKVLHDSVRVIQGDGIGMDTIGPILDALTDAGFSAENVAFGMGGGLLQHCDRDWGRWAMKNSASMVKDEWRDVFKSPKGDTSKGSKRGVLYLNQDMETHRLDDMAPGDVDLLECVFLDGERQTNYTLEDIRDNARGSDFEV